MGLKGPGGRRRTERVKDMARKTVKEIERVLEDLPAPIDKPPERMTLLELSTETNRVGLAACLDMCRRYTPDMDIKERRLIAEIAGMTLRANVRLAEGEFRARSDDVLGRLIEMIEAERERSTPAAPPKI